MNGKSSYLKKIGLPAGIILSVLFYFLIDMDPENPLVTATASVAILMAVWWISEALPLGITALIPVFMFPLLGIMNGKTVASQYLNHIIFLMMGGFLVALAMQKWDLHKRIALVTLMLFGTKPRRILLGFMIATSFLSMWISNTATTMMMIPIVLSVVLSLENQAGAAKVKKYSIGLMLGVAYSASIGGMATLVGTPPNLSFARIFSITFPEAPEISFAKWLIFALPVCVFLLTIVWLLLSFLFCRKDFDLERNIFRDQYKKLGKASREELIVLIDFALMALLWLFRSDISIGDINIKGWSNLFQNSGYINDGTVAIACATILFIIPAKGKSRIMDWNTASGLPWNIILLLGGGFALASGFKESGLSLWFGDQLAGLKEFSPVTIVFSITALLTFLTELTSNTATAEMLLPILSSVGVAIGKNPLLLMIPATMACSCAFMLPVATPPNAIVFGTQRISIKDMVRAGFILNIIAIITLTIAIFLLGGILDIDVNSFPAWLK